MILLAEWRLSMWSTIDVNEKTINVVETFRPRPQLLTGTIKAVFLGWSIQVMVSSLTSAPDSVFWMAYLTNWSLVLTICYQTLSFSRMLLPVCQDPVDFLTRLTWGAFACVANLEAIVTLLFWTLQFKGGPVSYVTIMAHAILLVEVWFDGFLLNRTPIRLKQVVWVYIVATMFMIWTGIHAASGIGNPVVSDNNPSTDDDAIYQSINWNKRPGATAVVMICVFVVLIPILIIVTLLLSKLLNRRYIENPMNLSEAQAGETDDNAHGVN